MQPFMFIHYSKPSLLHSHYLARALGRFIKNKKKQEKKTVFAKLVAFKGASGVQVGGKLIITTSSRQAGVVS